MHKDTVHDFSVVRSQSGVVYSYDKEDEVACLEVDTMHANISLGGIFETGGLYTRKRAKEFYDALPDQKPFAVLNGQFFNAGMSPATKLAFSVKSQGESILDYLDNDLPKRTFLVRADGGGEVREDYDSAWMQDASIQELIVGISPKTDMISNQSVGRTFVAVSGKKVYFFIAKARTFPEMLEILSRFALTPPEVVMLDGGPSSQYYVSGDANAYF